MFLYTLLFCCLGFISIKDLTAESSNLFKSKSFIPKTFLRNLRSKTRVSSNDVYLSLITETYDLGGAKS